MVPVSAVDFSIDAAARLGVNEARLPADAIAQIAEVPVLHHDLFTNGIAYLDIGFDLRVLPQELLPYIPLIGRSLLEMGTRRESFVDLQQRIGAQTGGVWTQSLLSSRRDGGPGATWLFLRGKAMVDRVDELARIARAFCRWRWRNGRVRSRGWCRAGIEWWCLDCARNSTKRGGCRSRCGG